MSRMSGPKRKQIYQFLVRRDSEFCFIGGEPGNSETLVIDHWDNDNTNNDPSNHHLMCRPANAVKNPRGRDRRHKQQSLVYVSERESLLEVELIRSCSAELKKGQVAEPAFRHWLFREVVRRGKVPVAEVIHSGAAMARCSQITVRRYLDKELSPVRLYESVTDPGTGIKCIQLKQRWATFRKKEEERKILDQQARNWRDQRIEELKATPIKQSVEP